MPKQVQKGATSSGATDIAAAQAGAEAMQSGAIGSEDAHSSVTGAAANQSRATNRRSTSAKELRKLKRAELLEIMLAQSEEIDRLRKELAQKDAQLADRTIAIKESGSIAEASLKLTKVFEEAQKAADLYLANVRAGNAGERAAGVATGARNGASSASGANAGAGLGSTRAGSASGANLPEVDPREGE